MNALDDAFEAIRRGDEPAVDALLDRDPALLDGHDRDGSSLLLTALYHGRPRLAAALVARGAPVNVWEASALGDLHRLQSHLDARPTLRNAYSHDGWTPLHLASHFGHGAAVRFLLQRGADVRARSTNPLANEPIHAALAGGSLEVTRMLLDAGADPNAVEHGGYAPLHQAAEPGDVALIELLLARGARPDLRDGQGRTALDLATAGAHSQAAEALRRAASA